MYIFVDRGYNSEVLCRTYGTNNEIQFSNDRLMKENEIKNDSVATKPKPLKKLKPIPQNSPKKIPEPEKSTPEKKRIIIGELPDYDSLLGNNQETIPEEKPKEEKKSEPEKIKKIEKPEKKGFFSRVKDLMYVSAEDEEEQSGDDEPHEEKNNDEISFALEEVTENIHDTMDIVNEVLAESKNKTPEPKSEPIKESEKNTQQSSKKNKNKKSQTANNKKKQEEIPEPEKTPESESPKKPDKNKKSQAINNEKKQEEIPEPEKTPESEPPKKTEKNTQQSSKKKKNKNKNKKSQTVNNEKKQEKIPEPEKTPESEQIKESEPEEPKKQPEQEIIPEEEEVIDDIPEISEEKSDNISVKADNGKYKLPALLCVILAVIGIIAIINTCISKIGGGSSKEILKKAIYPVVITDINQFESPSELTDNQILSSAIWSVIIDNKKLSQYPQRVDNMAIIPAEDIENFAKDIFGNDMRELTHSTIVTADSKFYYNQEANSYSVDIKPYTFTYSPEITSVSKSKGKYIVEVDYIAEHPEWMEDSVSKSAEFTLSKNGKDSYTIISMKEIIPE